MQIAYLLLAHKNLEQLCQLIEALTFNCENYCFIHLDGRMHRPSAVRKLNQYLKGKNWKLIKQSHVINWGGFSMVEAILDLILCALNHPRDFKYLSLHSGQDLPLKSNSYITNFFNARYPKSFLEYFELPNDDHWKGGGLDRVNHYSFLEEIGHEESFRICRLQEIGNFKREIPINIKRIYGGSQWFTIADRCAKKVIETINKQPEIFHFFRYVYIPDEIFFQTIILNFLEEEIETNNLRLIDWKSGPEFPKVFVADDKELLVNSDSLFARKFDYSIDNKIIDDILSIVRK